MGNLIFGLIWVGTSMVLGEAATAAARAGKSRFEKLFGVGEPKRPKKLTGRKKR